MILVFFVILAKTTFKYIDRELLSYNYRYLSKS